QSTAPNSKGFRNCLPLCTKESIMVAFRGIWTQTFWKAVSGEFLAMLIFAFLSLGSTISWSENQQLVLMSLCFGLSLATMIQCFGHISGTHINPAVTISLVCIKKLSLAKAIFYVAAQCLGAVVGAGLLYLVTPADRVGNLGATLVNSSLSAGQGLLIEIIITFQLVFNVVASSDTKRNDVKGSIALAVGYSVTIGHLFAINYTGASMNPARSFGPAVIMGIWDNHWWVYWVGPLMGGISAAALYEYLYCPDPELKCLLKEVLAKATKPSGGKHREVEAIRSQEEADDLITKPGTAHVIDIEKGEEKKEKDSSGEMMSSV
uniref:Aquaporin-4 n=1 Tax=Latimeria chalumnae TaxID=7897 RepID=H3ADX5_LATCH